MNWEIESIEKIINNLKRMINELKNSQYNTLNNSSNLTMGKLFYDFINSSGMKIFIIASIYSVLVELGLMIFFQYVLNSIGNAYKYKKDLYKISRGFYYDKLIFNSASGSIASFYHINYIDQASIL